MEDHQPRRDEASSPFARTVVAVVYPALAVGAAVASTSIDAHPISGSAWMLALVALTGAYGVLTLPAGGRSRYTFGRPTIVLTGFIGGPLLGLLAGVALNLTEPHRAWRRRATYAGLDGLQGVMAGYWGLAVARGEIALEPGLALACVWALIVGATGRLATQFTRGAERVERVGLETGFEALEFALVSPLLVLAARESAGNPGLVVLACASLLAITAAGWAFHRHHTKALGRERERANTDPLTGALSRAAFQALLERQHARVVNGDPTAAVFVADIDRFKRINDTFRHVTGDAVLQEAVARLQQSVRPGDVVARWGGDEFIVLAPGLDTVRAAADLAERLRRAFFGTLFETGAEALRVTLSVGGALLDGAVSADEAIDRADQALYRAKSRRNRAVVLGPPPPPEPAHAGHASLTVRGPLAGLSYASPPLPANGGSSSARS